jgi:PAS domain S-box-containing protein
MANLSTLPDLIPWPFLICNRAGVVLFANPLVNRTLGRPIQVGTDINDLFMELDNGRAVSTLLYAAARWSAWSGLLELRNPEKGSPIRAARIVLQPDPKFIDQVWLFFADDALINGMPLLTPRSGMGLARTLIENSPDFIIFRDLQGRILHTSRSLDEFLALPHRGFGADLGLNDILAPSTAHQFLQFDEEVIRTGQRIRHGVMHFETLDGRSRQVRVVHERVKGGGGLPAGLLTFAVNITESIDEHNRLRVALDRAEEVAAAKWQFVANVTHEIRNPINAIQGLCETGLEATNARYDELLRKIQRCANELEDTVRDVLDFSRLDRGNVTIESIPFNPIRALEEVIAQFQHQAQGKGVELAALSAPDAPHSILGDPVKFRRIIANLVSNAVKFTQHGQVYTSLEFEERNGRLRALLTVKDSGIGISSERLESIFEPFTQADPSTTRKFGGTGLGLTIVRSLAQAMDGYVKVTSEAGQGSVFSAAVMVDPNPSFIDPPSPHLPQQNFLIVGGHPDVRKWLIKTFQHWGASCQETTSYEEAEKLWAQQSEAKKPFDRAIIDLPYDLNPRLPSIPPANTLLITSPELEFRSQAQLLKPLTLSALWAKFSGALPSDEQEGDRHAQTPLHAPRTLRILVAEDNEVNREVAVARLRRAGHEVSGTVDGSAAVELWQTKDFDVALLDIQMPVMDGITAAQTIRALESSQGRKRTTLIALTAMTQETDRAKCEAAGFDAYLAKPVRGAELLEKIDLLAPADAGKPLNENDWGQMLDAAEAEEAEDLRCAARAFLKHAQEVIQRLEQASQEKEPENLSREAHGIKGMLSLMGCKPLARLAHSLEEHPADATAPHRAQELISGLHQLYESLLSRTDLSPHGQAENQT